MAADRQRKNKVMPATDRTPRLPPTFNRLAWSNLAAQSAEQIALAAAPIVARQACFRPVTEDGLPLIGRVPQIEGLYVATGHNVWGILNAPATGEALAELIADGVARSTDLTPFDPIRLRPLDPSLLRSV